MYNQIIMQSLDLLINDVCAIANQAGRIILKHYDRPMDVQIKDDFSPITVADLESNKYICSQLSTLTPEIPIVSEENDEIPYSEREKWDTFWLVDPLDGTIEFVRKSGHFTVNIALISNRLPVLGVVDVPALNEAYFGYEDHAFRVRRDESETPVRISVRSELSNPIEIVASKDNQGPTTRALCKYLPDAQLKSMGSSLKFCMIADGQADVYLRDGSIMEWDSAAAHAVVRGAGGDVYTLDGQVLTYNKKGLINPHTITIGSNKDYWFDILKKIV